MVEYEIIEAKEIPFGRNNFIEVARKKAIKVDITIVKFFMI